VAHRWHALVIAAGLTAAPTGTGWAQTVGPAAPGASSDARIDPSWLTWDPATRTARFKLIAGLTGKVKSPFNFNGFVDGEVTLQTPADATVVMDLVNEDGTPHSAMVIPDRDPMPNMGDTPAIPRAYSRKATEGLGYFEKDVIRFKAAPAGAYRIFCGVPGHGLSGMWIRLVVDSTLTEARLVPSPKPS
jgi:sulfocyanin